MKSMRAKQSPQRSPWLEMRDRQAMQTGGSSKLPNAPNADHQAGTARIRPSPVSLTAMRHMIQQQWGVLEAKRLTPRMQGFRVTE